MTICSSRDYFKRSSAVYRYAYVKELAELQPFVVLVAS